MFNPCLRGLGSPSNLNLNLAIKISYFYSSSRCQNDKENCTRESLCRGRFARARSRNKILVIHIEFETRATKCDEALEKCWEG